jgi:tetratricopeptide (TPR) repeat protein
MATFAPILKSAVTSLALALALALAVPVAAQETVVIGTPETAPAPAETLDQLYDRLADPATEDWEAVTRRIEDLRSRTGSVAMDLLLRRGRDALEAEDYAAAVEHLTAVTDHAPDVAEGWHLRATAFFHLGRYGEALDDIGRTLALDPRHSDAMSGLAVILGETGAAAESLEVWRMVKAANPHRPDLDDAITRLERETAGSDI